MANNKKKNKKKPIQSSKELIDKLKPKIQQESSSKKDDANRAEQLKQKEKEYLYLQAEFENYKKQTFKEKKELLQYGAQPFVQSLVEDVLDDLERSLLSDSKTIEEIKKGLEIIYKKLQDTLSRFGITAIDPQGQAFDPSYQEALSQEVTKEVPPGHVLTTFKKAYKLHDKVIRPAQVVVAKDDSDKQS